MLFPSEVFLFLFLPFVLAVYYLVLRKHTVGKNIFLFIMSLLFYAYGEPKYVFLMLFMILLHYGLGLLINKYTDDKRMQKLILFLMVVIDVCILGYFKYLNFIVSIFTGKADMFKIALPIGISFFTFQAISYVVDVYRGKGKVQTQFLNVGLYISLFPQLIAGPIVRYETVANEIENRKENLNDFAVGVNRFIIGLGKKVLLANNLGILWEEAQSIGFANISTPMAWLSLLAFSLQIYYDFSGYSTMAIGLGKMLGFVFPKNFNYPYISKSISEFWRRWHITLGSWFKEYIYIPLGGNRKGKKRTFLNLLIVWFLTGLWHGAEFNFILWGLYFFLLISLEKLILDKYLNNYKLFAHFYTIFMLLMGWAIFAITDLNLLKIFLKQLFAFKYNTEWIYYLQNYLIIIVIGVVCSTPVVSSIWNRLKINKYVSTLILISIFILSVAYLVDSSYNPFLYFRF